MFGTTKRGEIKPPSEDWYEFAERVESETRSDAAAGYTAEEFLPSFWTEASRQQSSADFATADRDSSNGVMWFLTGLGVGALLGVLYAPHSGRETRDTMRNAAQEGKDFIKTRGREAREAVGEWVERGKDVVNRQKDHFSSAFEAGREGYHEASGSEGTKKS